MLDVLDKKEYLVQVTIIEGRNITSQNSGGTQHPFLKVRCADQVQQSQKKYEQNSAIWNQSLTFSGVAMNQYELETFELILEVYDHDPIFTNQLIGMYSIGLSTLYRNLNHEFYKVWVGIFNPIDPNRTQGYLQISCFIVGPNERPPVHPAGENFGDDDQNMDDVENEEELIQRLENYKRMQGLQIVNNPGFIQKSYQLTISVAKAESLPFCRSGTVNSFVSARVNGLVQTTKTVTKNQDPVFMQKLLFPITYPILNNKITVRIWSQNSGLHANTYIGNIPEHPSEFDYFNISKLLSNDGKMPPTWFNIYGVLPAQRGEYTKSKREGSCYLGRALIAFNIVPNDCPLFTVQSGVPSKEPKQGNFQLWVDLYEWSNCKLIEPGQNHFVEITVGTYKSQPIRAARKKGPGKVSLTFQESGDKAIDIKCEFPKDFAQIPDVIVNFYINPGEQLDSEKRVGYIRIQARDVARKYPNPQWMRIKSPYNNQTGNDLGQMMMNVQFLRYDPLGGANEVQKYVRDKSNVQMHRFYYQILSGFELATSIPDQALETTVQIQVGSKQIQLFKESDGGEKVQNYKVGRYPFWNSCGYIDEKLQKELAFNPDVKISLIRKVKKKAFGLLKLYHEREVEDCLGEFCVDITSIQTKCARPQFYNLLNIEGSFVGQILANFFIQPVPKFGIKDIILKKEFDLACERQLEEFKQASTIEYTNQTIKFSLFGIRNLIKKANRPVVVVRLTQDCIPEENNYGNNAQIKDSGLQSSHKQSANKHVSNRSGSSKQQLLNQVEMANVSDKKGQGVVVPDEKKAIADRHTRVICYETQEDDYRKPVDSRNPTFAASVEFSNVNLYSEPLTWPMLEITVTDRDAGSVLLPSGCETCFTTVSLLDYAEDILGKQELLYTRAQLQRNQDQLLYVQQQIDPQTFLRSMGIYQDDPIEEGKGEAELDFEKNEQKNVEFKNELNNQNIKVSHHLRNTIQTRMSIRRQEQIIDLFDDVKQYQGWDDEDELFFSKAVQGDREDQDLNFGEGEGEEGEENVQKKFKGQNDDLVTGIVIGTDQGLFESLSVTSAHKLQEVREREKRLAQISAELKAYQNRLNEIPEEDIEPQRFLKMKMMGLNQEEEELNSENMTVEKFWGQGSSPDEEEDFDYGRDILKELTYEQQMKLPYQVFPLFKQANWYAMDEEETFVVIGGLLRSGILTGAVLKAHVCLSSGEFESDSSDDAEQDAEEQGKQNEDRIQKKLPHEEIKDNLNLIQKHIPFKTQEARYLDILKSDCHQDFKIRVYLISVQNIAAMTSVIDMKSRLAGMNAMCSANPFPVIKVGDGNNANPLRLLKMINDKDSVQQGELNPEFLKIYELDAKFPEDWSLEISIMDQASSQQSRLIGKTSIDLESRRHANQLFQSLKSYPIAISEIKDAIKQQKNLKKKDNSILKIQLKKNLLEKIFQKLKTIQCIIEPVEFREIYHPQKKQAQGIIEMFSEILSVDDARKIPVSKVKSIHKQKYEMRVIIWETKEVSLGGRDSIDIFTRCTFDPTGWSSDEVTKDTDVHMNSKDGNGQFNWRMKFDLQVPCDFPRLKFMVLNGSIVADTPIGECTLSLKGTLQKLRKEERVSIPKSYLTIVNPSRPDEDKGIIMFSLDILTKEDADQNPVGDAQDEPNKDPFLKKPTAGRGLGDALAALGVSVDLGGFSWNPFGKFLPFVIAAGVLGLVVTLAFLFKK